MKKIEIKEIPTTKTRKNGERVPRNQREDLISQILDQCTLKPHQRKVLGKLLSITANTAGWTTTDLHALLKKKQDPAIRNYTAFVWYSAKMTRSKAS